MFDIGWPELLLIMVVALVVIGPKELPAAIRTVTTILRKMRGMAREFQSGLDDIAREAGFDDIKREFDDVTTYDPKAALENIAGIEGDDFALDGPVGGAGNSIRDPAVEPPPLDDDPDVVLVPEDGAPEAAAVTDAPGDEPASEDVAAADEEEPAQRPASGSR